jgi:F-type H+-transporting ATPase subunit b|tara:strand:- start:10441 stop:10977 length:537 start_codon:yes stop_codon:yes gene_type:complete
MIALASLSDVTTGIVEKFGVDTPLLIAQAINFVIVAFVIWQFALKKILLTIDEREKKIADSLKNAEKIKLELEATEKQQNETLQEASLEAKKTVATAQEQAKSYIEAQKEEARKQAEEIVEKARSAMELERQRVLNDAREEIASLVILTTSKVLQRELGDEEKSRFSESAAKEISLSN